MSQKKVITKHVGILCAMPEEIGSTINNLENVESEIYGDLEIYSGDWIFSKKNTKSQKVSLSIAWSGWGKVSSARAATRLISHKFNGNNIEVLFFTGVAGAINPNLKQWDIILPNELIQHDMDARPLFKRYEIPALGKVRIKSDQKIFNWSFEAIKRSIQSGSLEKFGKLYSGLVATGDKFISDKEDLENILKDMRDLLAVEMEGASVAQVAEQEKIPFQLIRVISDQANDESPEAFNQFLIKYKKQSSKIISSLIENIELAPS